MPEKAKIMDSIAMERALTRISHEIIEKNNGTDNLVIVGIQRRGVTLAKLIHQKINKFENIVLPMGILDITFYRDDLSMLDEHPVVNGTDIPFDLQGKIVIIVDDVLFTGRTARASLDAIMDLGRPKSIQLAVLIDRGHRELPIRADYVGKNLPTSLKEVVHVRVNEFDDVDEVVISDLD